MAEIYVLEHFDFSQNQLDRLNKLGTVHYFDYADQEQIEEATQKADAILFDWIDPNILLQKISGGIYMSAIHRM